LIYRLLQSGFYTPIFFKAGEVSHSEAIASLGAYPFHSKLEEFHFGKVFEEFIDQIGEGPAAYFGGGSGPLLTTEFLSEAAEGILAAQGKHALVNNYHSSDWILLRSGKSSISFAARMPADNMLGWVLDHEAGYQVAAAEPCAATRADLDTPVDFIMLHGHPDLGSNLQEFLGSAPDKLLERIQRVKEVMNTPASQLTLIGRSSPAAQMEISRRCQIWTRVFSEERGMVASGRKARGEVRSLIADYIQVNGVRTFVAALSAISDAVLWDTRVWMAANGAWPSAAERFSLDLGMADELYNPDLLELAEVIEDSEIPIVHGGHGVVAGGLYSILETLDQT
jgi:hypothetical protein